MNIKSKLKKHKTEEKISGLLMIAPAFILLVIFVFVPLIMAVVNSFFYYESGPQDAIFAGFDNYVKVFQRPEFVKSLGNVTLMTTIIVILQVAISFFFANILVKMRNKFSVFVRTIIYLPNLFSGVVIACLFTLFTTFNGGIINGIITSAGGEPIAFTNDVFWAYVSIIVPTLWIGSGYTTLVFYSGLINIPKDYYEAADVDGANWWKKTFYITLPNLKHYFVLIIVTLVTGNLQMFEIPMIMTNGMPLNATMTPVLYLIHARANGNVSQSEIIAASILIMILIASINAAVFALANRKQKGVKKA